MDRPVSNQPSPPTATTILVVDDEPSIVKLCRALLQPEGFTILEADGSSEALKICAKHEGSIDVLLTDLVLPPPGFQLASGSNEFPHVHGHELAMRAATLRTGLRIILMSGNPDKELASHGIKRGTLPFVQKPFEKSALTQLIRDVLQSPPPTLKVRQGNAANDIDWFG
ncbi:response regulator [Nitrospira lenta]|uniref:Putative Response Regulator n=1 Tax=Nitrospira lenta TaxID=1436998 RepID=A0A330L7W8_9BACT|nr:response regulator [Nitrospira lenta]SPP65796.1 putative Response Regulator [Nitrospira lenta]